MVAESRLLKSIAALTEEGEGAAPDGGSGFEVGQPAGGATAAGAIASLPARLGSGKHKTEMRRRNDTKPFLALIRKHRDPRNYKDIDKS
jgi:hypothetical protein